MLNKNLEEKYANPRGRAEVTREKLPAVLKKGSGAPCYQSVTRVQEKNFDRRHGERSVINEWQQPYTERINPQRQYRSARINGNIYPEPDSMPIRKVDRVDMVFPLKPVYHKRSFTANIDSTSNEKDDVQSSPSPYVPSPPRGRQQYSGRARKTETRKVLEVSSSSLEDFTNCKDLTGSQQLRGERLPDEQRRLTKEIHKKELVVQEKLLKLGRRIQRDRVNSGDDIHRREERHTRTLLEEGKEWNEKKVPAEHRRRDGERGQERTKREKSDRREKAQEDIDWERGKREEMKKDRREKKKAQEEDCDRWERRDDEKEKKLEWKTERRRSERGMDLDGVWDRHKRDNLKEREWPSMGRERMREEEDEKETCLAREKKLLWNRWEMEKTRPDKQSRKVAEEDIDWRRDNKWERSRDVLTDGRRKEQEIAHHGKIHGDVEKPAHRLVSGGSRTSSKGNSREPSYTSTLTSPPHSSRLLQELLNPNEFPGNKQQRIPCTICNRHFLAERLEKHYKVCDKMHSSNRKVFDSSKYRAKGTELEEYMKTNQRSKTPETKKSNWKQKHEIFIHNLRHARAPNGTSQPESSIQDPDYVTCLHCGRRFAPGPAERHIPKCQNIKSRPPPPRHRR